MYGLVQDCIFAVTLNKTLAIFLSIRFKRDDNVPYSLLDADLEKLLMEAT